MKKQSFLNKLWEKNRISLVEPSENICNSYIKKAENSLKSASILIKNNLYEDSISKSYYTLYNVLTALLYKIGIKCENHTASILMLKLIFKTKNLYKTAKSAKKERIEKQYYIDSETTKTTASDTLKDAEEFLINIKVIIKTIKKSESEEFRRKLKKLIKK